MYYYHASVTQGQRAYRERQWQTYLFKLHTFFQGIVCGGDQSRFAVRSSKKKVPDQLLDDQGNLLDS